MGAEKYALFLDLPESRKGKHLKSAGIRKNRTIPCHKLMQTSDFLDQFIAGAHMQMVSVG